MILSAEEEKGGGKRTIPTVGNLQRKSRIVRVFLGSSWGQADKDLLADLTNRQLTAVTARHRHGDQGIAAATMALLAPWVRPPTRCAWAGAAHAASDREGFDACGEEDRAERPAHKGNGAGTGGSWRVAAPPLNGSSCTG